MMENQREKNMENEKETVVIWGFTEPNLSHCIGETLLLTSLYPLWQLNLSSLTAKPVILEAGFSSLFRWERTHANVNSGVGAFSVMSSFLTSFCHSSFFHL